MAVQIPLPVEVVPGRGPLNDSPSPVLSQYLGKNVIILGEVKSDVIRGVGLTQVLVVKSIKISQ